ncbi:glycerophosphodiester phosphodiesterase [Martelella alba]|uniref:Glycerophosphodiester phosphodiesterase n=1 Tax=Martelella alba TaxID=2590451 RepID=A0A506UI87_9HYPH|nr:glycerophosphodiester phosphodiesterase family protein [Martelella alba]TPW33020.1 glycerophosphodiester phosphodiesterase [Martelella alba]
MSEFPFLTAQPIAHRGYHDMNKAVWENSLPAFKRAIDAGFAIECDLHLSADGIPMVFHDDDLKRLCGLDLVPENETAERLATIKIGTTDATIPSFTDLLALTDGRVPLVVELKTAPSHNPLFATAVLDCLAGYKGPVALMSFDAQLLRDLKSAGAPRPLGLTAMGDTEEAFDAHRKAVSIGLDFVSYYYDHLPNAFISGLKADGKTIITWTVRDERARDITFANADQMTFEGFDPRV